MPKDPQLILERLIRDRETYDAKGNRLEVTGTISLPEAQYIRDLIVENNFRTCVETGVAYGASTVAICSALAAVEDKGADVKHYGVDPCQFEIYGGAAMAVLRECGLERCFELCEGPGHLMLPKLIERGVTIDFAFIDGMHTFDYTMIDLFFCDKLLRVGGILCVHDMNMPSKKKAVSYLMKYRKYARVKSLRRPFRERVGSALKEALNFAPGQSLSYLTTVEPMLVLKKVAFFEPGWDFYTRF
ncbi:MAG TPA: class I SAM-dependent methyltransferase [Blastocatellia bacterium]|nr:class I SAM-dependent methyltransferase [Blastocatellia bacterium]